jgi:arginine repressor
MARAKHGAKSQAVRELLKQDANMKTRDIVAALAEKGMKIRSSTVYMIKARMRRNRRRQAVRAAGNDKVNAVHLVLKIKGLAAEAGGINNLKQLVDALAL